MESKRACPGVGVQVTPFHWADDVDALHDAIDRIAAKEPSQVAVVDRTGASVTYKQLVDESIRAAYVLLQRGLTSLSERPVATIMRRSGNWMIVYVASMRCGVPMLGLSVDLFGDRGAEKRRNSSALQDFAPQCLVYESVSVPGFDLDGFLQSARNVNSLFSITFDELVKPPCEDTLGASTDPLITRTGLPVVRKQILLAYCYTGGSTKASKVVKITHAMAIHELRQYYKIFPSDLRGASMRFLQNSSPYWGAALLGQVDVALAMEGTVVMVEATQPAEIVEVVERFGVTAFGAVPSVLDHITPADVSSVRCVIAWADALPEATAARWQHHVHMLDLLIATEYWLAFYSVRSQGHGRTLTLIDGVHVKILDSENREVTSKAQVGELCISGDTVSPGYLQLTDNEGRFLELDGRQYFRTSDLANWIQPGRQFQYCGRCGDMAKVGGKWVDLTALESTVQSIPGVSEAKLVFSSQERNAFVILQGAAKNGTPWSSVLDDIRRELPPDTMVHVVSAQQLPRHPATGKVNNQLLLKAVQNADLDTVLKPRHEQIASRLARTLHCASGFCHQDPRRMLCLAYIWYTLVFCPDYAPVRQKLAANFPTIGGERGCMLALVWGLPLQQLQRLAAPGAAHAQASGRGLQWIVVFWASLPSFFSPAPHQSNRQWVYTMEKAAERAVNSIQMFASKWKKTACPTCNLNVSLFPSLTHCCKSCPASGGRTHDYHCLQQNSVGWRKCKNCNFCVTWEQLYCCHACDKEPGTHGPQCDKEPHCVFPKSEGAEDVEMVAVEADGVDRKTAKRKISEPTTCLPAGTFGKHCSSLHALLAGGKPELAWDMDIDNVSTAPPIVENESVLALLQRIGGMGPSEGILLLDSLRSLRLLAAIRNEFGRALTLRDLNSCSTVQDLVDLIGTKPALDCHNRPFPEPGIGGFRLWTFGWNNCLQWVFRCSRMPTMSCLRASVTRLMQRQPALRLRHGEVIEVQNRFMEAAAMLDLLRHAPRLQSLLPVWKRALKECWPRWYTPPVDACFDDTTLIQEECEASDMMQIIKRMKRSFSPPFQMAAIRNLSSTPDNDDEGYIAVMLSHAIADGSAVVPFLHSLVMELQRDGLVENGIANGTSIKSLPPLPHFGAILEDRLLRSIDGSGQEEDLMFLDRRMDFFGHHFPATSSGYSQGFQVPAAEIEELGRVTESHVAGCSIDYALLSLLVITIARIGGQSRVKFTLVHHGRDNPPGATDVVGFFTDFRTLEVPTSDMNSLIGVLNFMVVAIRERRWRRPVIPEPIDILINIVPSPFEEVGDFSQMRGYSSPPHADGNFWQDSRRRTSCKRTLEFQIEQADKNAWDITMYLAESAYSLDQGQRFRKVFELALKHLREDPLRGVLEKAGQSVLPIET